MRTRPGVLDERPGTRDPKELETYSKMAPATLTGHPANVCVAYGHHEVVEDPEIEGMVILEFPSIEAAKRGTIIPPIGKHASIASKGPSTAP